MKKFLQKKLKDQKGMTLIELLAVIVIIAIIAAIAIPAIGNIIDNSRQNAVKADVQMVLSSANLYFTETGAADTATATLGAAATATPATSMAEFIDDPGDVTSATVTKKATGNEIDATVNVDGTIYTFDDVTNAELSEMDPDAIKGLITTP